MGQCRGDGLIDGSGHLAVAQFGLGLAFELRFLYLDRNYSGKSFAEVVAVDLEFYFGEHTRIFRVLFQRTCQCTSETGQVRPTLDRVDVVDVRVDILREARIVLHRHLYRNAVALRVDIDRVVDQ